MNIIHLNTHDWYGGAAIVANRLAKYQRNSNHNSKIICGFRNTKSRFSFDFKINKNKDPTKNLTGWVDYEIEGSVKLPHHDLINKGDVLHIHNLHGGYFNYEHLPSLTQKIPSVWTLHDMQSFTGRCAHSFACNKWETGCGHCPDLNYYPRVHEDRSAQMWKSKKQIFSRANFHLVCPSKWMKEKVSKSILKEKDISLIYNGVDEKLFKPSMEITPEIHNLDKSNLLVGFMAHGGVKNPYKGGRFFKDAIVNLKEKFPKVYFLEIGGDPDDKELPNHVIKANYTKNQKTIVQNYNSIDLLVYPSTADNCPLVVLEAMACGIPIVGFPVGGVPELIEHNKSGLITDDISTRSLIETCSLLIKSKKLRTHIGFESRKRVLNSFTLKQQSDAYLQVYKHALNRQKT